MKPQKLLFSLLFLLALSVGLPQAYAQQQLPAPDAQRNARTEGGFNEGGPAPGSILYGAVPPEGQNAPVLLFIHGYSSSAATWYEDNSMYTDAYYSGYRTAFVSVYPDRNSWENGAMFADMIQTVCNTYGVAKVNVIAHSKGGVDSDAALVHYGAYDKVDRVITLGTPHFGTPLADLAQSNWVSWLSNVFGQFNDATAQLQTGTMSYFRSVTDNDPDNANTDFRVVGGTDYYGVLWFPGWYLSFTESQNDGVVTYSSTQRPNSFSMPSQPLNHTDIAKGGPMWNNILPQLPSTNMRTPELPATPTNVNPNAVITSRTEVISSDRGARRFTVPEGVSGVSIQVRQMESTDQVTLRKADTDGRIKPIGDKLRLEDRFWGGYMTGYQLSQPEAGTYVIDSEKPFVAMVMYQEGAVATLRSDLSDEKLVYGTGEAINLKLELENAPEEDVKVTGFWKRTSDLRGVMEEGETEVIEFEGSGTAFLKTIRSTERPGVYNLSVQVEGDSFRRSLVTSIAVVPDGQSKLEENERAASFAITKVFPNPSAGNATLQLDLQAGETYTLRVFDMSGRVVEERQVQGHGQQQISWLAGAGLNNGLYILELSNGTERQTARLVLMR